MIESHVFDGAFVCNIMSQLPHTDWMPKLSINVTTFALVLCIYLETHVSFAASHISLLDHLRTGDYCKVDPKSKLAIMSFLRDEVTLCVCL